LAVRDRLSLEIIPRRVLKQAQAGEDILGGETVLALEDRPQIL
jgi:hypothetical protein